MEITHDEASCESIADVNNYMFSRFNDLEVGAIVIWFNREHASVTGGEAVLKIIRTIKVDDSFVFRQAKSLGMQGFTGAVLMLAEVGAAGRKGGRYSATETVMSAADFVTRMRDVAPATDPGAEVGMDREFADRAATETRRAIVRG